MAPDVTRRIARLQYAAVRLPFTLLDESVVARYWDRDALVRAGFERWLGALDLVAGRLLGDDEISRRGQALIGQSTNPAQADGNSVDAPVQPVHSGQVPSDLPASDQAPKVLPASDVLAALPAGDQASEARAEATSRAVLQALAEQVDGDPSVLDRLGSQLSGSLQTALRAGDAAGQPPLRLGEFYQRVGDLAGVPPDAAEDHARTAVATLAGQVAGTPLEEFFARLPQDYRSLLPRNLHAGEAGTSSAGSSD